ncbi:MAG TPA: TolC family protein [Candidatus Hypogeohydataceae bacterium YC40]
MKRLLTLFFVSTLCFSGPAWAEEPTEKLRLQWVIEEALKNNPNIQVFLNRWEASQEAIARARSLDDPVVNFHTWNAENPITPDPSFDRAERRGVVSQKVPFPGKLRLRGKIAEEDSNIAKKDWEQQVLEILARVKGAYFQLEHHYEIIEINKEVKDILEKLATIASTRYKVGRAPQRDVLAAQVEIVKIIRELEVLERDKKAVETQINTILNRDPEAPLGQPEHYPVTPINLNLQELQEIAIKQRPELKKFDFAIKRNKSALDLAKKDLYFPDPEFMVVYMKPNTNTGQWMTQIAFNVPWFWNKNRAKVKESKETLQASEAEYQAVKNTILFQVKDFWTKTINARFTAKIYSESVIPLAEQSLKAALTEYGAEKIDFLTLLDSERTLLNVRIQYHEAERDFKANLAELERVVGTPLAPAGME